MSLDDEIRDERIEKYWTPEKLMKVKSLGIFVKHRNNGCVHKAATGEQSFSQAVDEFYGVETLKKEEPKNYRPDVCTPTTLIKILNEFRDSSEEDWTRMDYEHFGLAYVRQDYREKKRQTKKRNRKEWSVLFFSFAVLYTGLGLAVAKERMTSLSAGISLAGAIVMRYWLSLTQAPEIEPTTLTKLQDAAGRADEQVKHYGNYLAYKELEKK
jgi:hypothetical protein